MNANHFCYKLYIVAFGWLGIHVSAEVTTQ